MPVTGVESLDLVYAAGAFGSLVCQLSDHWLIKDNRMSLRTVSLLGFFLVQTVHHPHG